MVQFTADTEQICRAYNLQPQEVILSFALASGAPSPDAYRLIYHVSSKTTNNELLGTVQALLTNKPSIKILIQRIKNHQNPVTLKKEQQQNIQQETNTLYNPDGSKKTQEQIEEEKNELQTREGIIKNLINSVSVISGKDKVSGLQTLAKLQGFDKPEEINEEEKRTYFLPWVSHCRTCQLMKIYKQVTEQPQDQEKP
jgi:chromosome condensin MukBEF ATPase and DNA-binding subunit MukB